MYVCLSHTRYQDPAYNLGVCPDRESNQRSFGSEAHAQSTEIYQPGQDLYFQLNVLYGKPDNKNKFFSNLKGL